jgi:hypothetical protein
VALSLASLQVADADSEFREIIAWYEDLLDRTFPPTDLAWEPVKIGPTWQYDNGWSLPSLTLGWRVLAWCGVWLRDKNGNPWQFTAEQTRFILWFFALDEDGGFLYHSAVLQRLKGWGKDPLAACIAVAALFADVTFDHWDGDVPVGREEPSAWVQLVAVSLQQTQNTMKLFPSLISPEARRHYGIQVGKLNVYGLGDTRQIQAVTASPLAIEGGRPTLVVRNETQNWNASNGGHEMAGAIEGNAAKSEGGAARVLDICNAYRPGEDSVGQQVREGWDATQAVDGEEARTADFGLLYDSLEAPPEAPLTRDAAPGVVDSIRGDATWLSIKRIMASILNPANPASESRRKWFNQITATEDARFDPLAVQAAQVDEGLVDGDERFWWPLCDEWARRYGPRLQFWAVKTGDGKHAVAWDMSKPSHQAQFVPAVEQFEADLTNGELRLVRSGWLRQHLENAKRAPGRYGVSLRKEHRESARKIDLAVCAIGARMLRRAVQMSRVGTKERTGRAFFR